MRKLYTAEEDQIILDAALQAKESDLDLQVIFASIAEKLSRTQRAVEVRYYNLMAKDKKTSIAGPMNIVDLLRKAKLVIKDRDKYKELADSYKAQRDEYKREYERIVKDLEELGHMLE